MLDAGGQVSHGLTRVTRRFPVGAEMVDGGVHFRVWAPARQRLWVRTPGAPDVELESEERGYFSGIGYGVSAGTPYHIVLDGETVRPDPASRFQPQGPHGVSQVVDPATFAWTDHGWMGPDPDSLVIYEMHIGTFTREGTWAAAISELPRLAALGMTVIEVMPVADFPGRFGWGYDGVSLFAPTRLYGEPDDCRRFVDRAHELGLSVILDVVYNHFGPDGCYLREFSASYFTARYTTPWGEAINFDGEGSEGVRELIRSNAAYWIAEFHVDGLRLDATHAIFDASSVHILREIALEVRRSAGHRRTLLIAEDESQRVQLVGPPDRGGYGIDALWNDDFHHSAIVALTHRDDAYYRDYAGTPQELVSSAKWGYLYQGQPHAWYVGRRGSPAFGLRAGAFVNFLENHDQVANSFDGVRLHQIVEPAAYRAITALLLLLPETPMLFQGQEFGASSPFVYFADFDGHLGEAICTGRLEYLAQFRTLSPASSALRSADPTALDTFLECKLKADERERNAAVVAFHHDLLRVRRTDVTLRAKEPGTLDGALLSKGAFVLRYFSTPGHMIEPSWNTGHDDTTAVPNHRLLVVNLGDDLRVSPAPEPLLAAPQNCAWEVMWSSEDPRYGGHGLLSVQDEHGWQIPRLTAVLLKAVT